MKIMKAMKNIIENFPYCVIDFILFMSFMVKFV